jgi:hypothetical protein
LSLSKGALYYEPVKMDQFSLSIMEFIDDSVDLIPIST